MTDRAEIERLLNQTGRTPEEIKAALCVCTSAEACNLYGCYYSADNDCRTTLMRDALALIERLESERDAALAKAPKWISVEERLPEKDGEYLVLKVHNYRKDDGWMAQEVPCFYEQEIRNGWLGICVRLPTGCLCPNRRRRMHMTDLISRSAVLEILNDEFNMAAEERAEADNEKDRAFNAGEINCARRSTRKVKELPAIDAVPVVRCNLCKYYEQDTGFCQYWGGGNHWNGFCNCGARMDGESEEDTDGSQTD